MKYLLIFMLVISCFGQNESSLYFDGSDCLYGNPYRATDQAGTISMWVNPDAVTNYDVLFSQATSTSVFFRLRYYGSGPELDQRNADTETAIEGTTTNLTVGAWNHIVLTSNASTYQLYVNGILQTKNVRGGTDNGDWFADQPINLINIGSARTGLGTSPVSPIEGYIDEVSYYNIAKDDAWVTATYNSGVPYDMSTDSDIQSYWRFEEGTGTTTTSSLADATLLYFNSGAYAPAWSTDTPGWDSGSIQSNLLKINALNRLVR